MKAWCYLRKLLVSAEAQRYSKKGSTLKPYQKIIQLPCYCRKDEIEETSFSASSMTARSLLYHGQKYIWSLHPCLRISCKSTKISEKIWNQHLFQLFYLKWKDGRAWCVLWNTIPKAYIFWILHMILSASGGISLSLNYLYIIILHFGNYE